MSPLRGVSRSVLAEPLRPVYPTNHKPIKTTLIYQTSLQISPIPGSPRVKDALVDTILPAPPVLRSLFNLIPADAHFPEMFLDIFPVLSRSTWRPPETLGFPCQS